MLEGEPEYTIETVPTFHPPGTVARLTNRVKELEAKIPEIAACIKIGETENTDLKARVAELESTLVQIRANREHLSLNQVDKLITETLGR